MIDFIQASNYTMFFNYAILCLVIMIAIQCFYNGIFKNEVVEIDSNIGVFLTIVLILYMGLRPVSGVFGDTINYASGFYDIQKSSQPFNYTWGDGEWLFSNMMGYFAKNSNINLFFLFCSIIYVGSLWLAMYRIFKSYYFIPLLVIFFMFTFWSYGVNGIRNGMGASLFILAITYVNKIPIMIIIALLGAAIHKSIYLMVGAATISWFIKNCRIYISVWVICVILSYFFGTIIQTYFSSLSDFSGDDRFSAYLTGSNMIGETVQMPMTFRWDFLLYSSVGVIIGYYFILKRHFHDQYYQWIYNMYLITNAFWVLIIRAGYSNRFAQISWFILPLVLSYPFVKNRFWFNQEQKLGYMLLAFYAFTFYFNILS